MTYEELVQQCKALRLEAEKAEARFFAFLMVAESEHAEVWQGSGCSTFEQFIRSNDLCIHDRYLAFRDGANRCGVDMAVAHGVHWTMAVGKLRDVAPEPLIERAKAFVEVHHTAPSSQVVAGWVRELPKGRPVTDANVRRLSELDRLRQENADLRAKLVKAERRIAELESKTNKKGKRAA